MSSTLKKLKNQKISKKIRNLIAYAMILSKRGGFMKHRCEPKGGCRNDQREYMSQNVD